MTALSKLAKFAMMTAETIVFGAYHLGRLEALEEVKRLAKEAAREASE